MYISILFTRLVMSFFVNINKKRPIFMRQSYCQDTSSFACPQFYKNMYLNIFVSNASSHKQTKNRQK